MELLKTSSCNGFVINYLDNFKMFFIECTYLKFIYHIYTACSEFGISFIDINLLNAIVYKEIKSLPKSKVICLIKNTNHLHLFTTFHPFNKEM